MHATSSWNNVIEPQAVYPVDRPAIGSAHSLMSFVQTIGRLTKGLFLFLFRRVTKIAKESVIDLLCRCFDW